MADLLGLVRKSRRSGKYDYNVHEPASGGKVCRSLHRKTVCELYERRSYAREVCPATKEQPIPLNIFRNVRLLRSQSSDSSETSK